MADEQFYGEVPGYPEGSLFPDRAALAASRVHRNLQAAVVGGPDGAESVLLSGGYADDEDFGDEIIFTGPGNPTSTGGDPALLRSQENGRPVRVIRRAGATGNTTEAGYRYNGLYRVAEHRQEESSTGSIRRSRFIKLLPSEQEHWAADAPAETDLLKHDALAYVIAARLRRFSRKEPNLSFLLHVDGAWGSGKSTLLRLLRDHLEGDYLVVPFDSWQHAKVDPPWWALLVTLRQHVSRSLPWWRRIGLRVADGWARARQGSTPYLLTGLVMLGLVLGLALLRPAWLGQVKDFTTVLSVLGSTALVVLLISRFLWWDSARGARRLEQVHTNPMQEVTHHFSWLLARAPRQVVFFIDDLDRCGEKYVVDLLDAAQTLVRDAPKRKGRAGQPAHFVVAAHGNWLRRAYETVHQPFQGAVDEPGRTLGHLFLDKLFQLTIPMPTLGPDTKQQYFDQVLGFRTPARELDEDDSELLARIERSTTEREILEALRGAPSGQRQRWVTRAVEKMSEPEIAEVTEHTLKKFAALLDGNPRSMKRFANTYSVLRAARTLEGITVDSEVLAFWTILGIRWPILTDYLVADLNALLDDGSNTIRLDSMPEQYSAVLADAELRRVLTQAPVRLTPDLIRACCGALST